MSDIHALSGAYAVNALDDAERGQFEEHLSSCSECQAEVHSFCETAALIAEIGAQAPPASLRTSVLAGIGTIRPLPPLSPPAPTAPTSGDVPEEPTATVTPLRRRMFPILVAAAVAVILLAVSGSLVYRANHGERTTTTDLAGQVLNASDAVKLTEPVKGGGTLTLVSSKSVGHSVLIGQDVASAKPGTTYQMWLQEPGKGMVSAGLMPDATEPTLLEGDTATALAAAVSVEPSGGSPQPTTQPVALFPLSSGSTGTGTT